MASSQSQGADSNANGCVVVCIFSDTCGIWPATLINYGRREFFTAPERRSLSLVTTNSPPQNHLKMASISHRAHAPSKRLLFSSLSLLWCWVILFTHCADGFVFIVCCETASAAPFWPRRLAYNDFAPAAVREASSLLDTVKGLTQLRPAAGPGRMHCVRGWRFDGNISEALSQWRAKSCLQRHTSPRKHNKNINIGYWKIKLILLVSKKKQ